MIGLVVSLLPIVAIFIFAYQGYKTAAENERNPVGWAIAIIGTGLALQLLVPVVFLMLFGIVVAFSGDFGVGLAEYIVGISIVFWLIGVIGSFAAMMFLLNKAGTEYMVNGSSDAPPTPPTFN